MLLLLNELIFLWFEIIFTETTNALTETAGTKDTSFKFERITNNYFGPFLAYYGQEVVSGNCTSYAVPTMLSCRYIMNTSQPNSNNPPNVVSVGTLQNGDVSCQICSQNVSDLQLGPRLGFFTYYSWPYGIFSPASNGIYYYQFVTNNQKAQDAEIYCNNGSGWTVAYAITAMQKRSLLQFISVNKLDKVHVQANCSSGHWKDESTSPFNDVTLQPSHPYVQLTSNGQYQCINPGDGAKVVCMKNVFALPWSEI